MPQHTKPTPFVWSSSGANTDPGAPKKASGFIAEKPTFQNMNWLIKAITEGLAHISDFGIPQWDSTTDYAVGSLAMGYDGEVYISRVTPNVNVTPVGTSSPTLANWTPASNKFGIPAGTIFYTAGSVAPAGSLKANGAEVSRTTYARLFAIVGTIYGEGNGVNTFNLPDLRGEFLRSFDDGRGIDSGRVLGSGQADSIKAHTHDISLDKGENDASGSGNDLRYGGTPEVTVTTQSTGGTETRPRNIAMLACIKF